MAHAGPETTRFRRRRRPPADEIRAAERERIRAYVASRREGLGNDTYESGKDMAYLDVLQFLSDAGQ